MTLRILALAAALLVAGPASALLDDPSFEAATNLSTISNSAWSLVANIPDGINPSAVFFDSAVAASDGDIGVWFQSFQGQQEAGDDPADAVLTQTVSGVAAGDYTLTFDAAREQSFIAATWSASISSSGTGGSDMVELLVATFNDTGSMEGNPTTFQLDLVGVSAGDDLTVTVQMLDGVYISKGLFMSGFVDNFSLARVPEPGLGLLTTSGLAGLLLRRRRTRVTTCPPTAPA